MEQVKNQKVRIPGHRAVRRNVTVVGFSKIYNSPVGHATVAGQTVQVLQHRSEPDTWVSVGVAR